MFKERVLALLEYADYVFCNHHEAAASEWLSDQPDASPCRKPPTYASPQPFSSIWRVVTVVSTRPRPSARARVRARQHQLAIFERNDRIVRDAVVAAHLPRVPSARRAPRETPNRR